MSCQGRSEEPTPHPEYERIGPLQLRPGVGTERDAGNHQNRYLVRRVKPRRGARSKARHRQSALG
jgi:hypothetical protein